MLISLLCVTSLAYDFKQLKLKEIRKSNDNSTASEGLLLGATPTYIDIDGSNGLELSISRPGSSLYDYTVMFWFRSLKGYQELNNDEEIIDKKLYLFKLEKSVGCYITNKKDDDTEALIICENGDEEAAIEVNLEDLPDVESWMHITYSANYQPNGKSQSYIRIDISSFNKKWDTDQFIPVVSNKVYYGAGGPSAAEQGDKDKGFPGHYR